MSIFATIFYGVAWLFLMSGFFFFRRTEEKAPLITWIGVTIYLSFCFHAFFAAILCLIHVPLNLYVFGILDVIAGGLFWFFNKKRGALQKYHFNWYDLIGFALLILSVWYFAHVRWDGWQLNWNYEAVDPAARYREAMEYMDLHEVSRMFFAQLSNGMFMQFFAPWFSYDSYYRLYVLADVANLLLSGVIFYGVAKRYCKKEGGTAHFMHIASIICTFLYLYGYPANSTLYGFTYLQMGVNLIAVILVVNDAFVKEEMPKWQGIFCLMLLAHGIFQCYALFMPITFLAMGFSLLAWQIKRKKLLSLETPLLIVAEFALPVILGLAYTYMDVFVRDNVGVGEALTNEGGIYRDLYSNFYVFLPVAILGYFYLVRGKKNRLLTFLTPLSAVMTLAMFYLGYHAQKVSTYYFFKNYFLIWLLVFVLIVYALSKAAPSTRGLAAAYLGMWAFVAMMYVTGLEDHIQQVNNWYVIDNKSMRYNDLLAANRTNIQKEPLEAGKYDLMHHVYEMLQNGETDKKIPVASIEEETYFYESVTGQRLSDWMFFNYSTGGLEQYFDDLDAGKADYICVFNDSGLYDFQKDYFDSFEKVYENGDGFIAKVTPGAFEKYKAAEEENTEEDE